MYIDIVPNRDSPPAILLRESYRDENGRVKKRTLCNLSCLSLEQAHKMRAILRGGHVTEQALEDCFEVIESSAHGHVAAILGVVAQLNVPSLLGRGDSANRRNALATIVGRLLFPGSKLALSRQISGTQTTLAQELSLAEDFDENDIYEAMRWLWNRQEEIESRLAKRHFQDGCVVLYDLSSTWYEGSRCPLIAFGHNRDGKKGKKQINFGLLTNADGCPISIQVYPGNISDPATVVDQLAKLRHRFGLRKIVVVGDRGMLTSARLDAAAADPALDGYGWISALRSPQIKELVAARDIQPELFDQRALAEITSVQFPGERLVVCRNPSLASERGRKREELLAATENVFQEIQKACRRESRPCRGKDNIARRVQREAAKYKMLKHFELCITDDDFTFGRKEDAIAEEKRLDGFYVIRARNVTKEEMDGNKLVDTYKSLSGVERAFRAIKTTSLKVRPVFHHDEDMVRAHFLVCMLAYYVQWHMERKLAPVLFADEELETQKSRRTNPVEGTERSNSAKDKEASKRTDDGLVVHSFSTLLDELAGFARVKCAELVEGAGSFLKLTRPTELHRRVFDLLGVKLPDRAV